MLASLGRDEEARRWYASLGDDSVTGIPLQAITHLRQAEILERLGDRRQAARHYARFLELWREADPGVQPIVDSARDRLASLGRPNVIRIDDSPWPGPQ